MGPDRQRNTSFLARHYPGALVFLSIVLALVTLAIAVNHRFDHDEFEHVHSAWYVQNGHIPYRDFFQHHHPLFWYSMTPVLALFGESGNTLIALRVAMAVVTLGSIFLTYLMARAITSSRETGLLSALLLLSMEMFVDKSIEIRPDCPQVFFSLLSIYFFVLFLQKGSNRHMALAGLAASISFLFLQKAIFLLMIYGLIFPVELFRKRIPFKSVLCFTVSFLLPLFCFFIYLAASRSLEDYYLTNWVLNFHQLKAFLALETLGKSMRKNGIFWVLLLVSLSFILFNKKLTSELKMITLIGLILLLSVFLVKAPFRQYFMPAIPLLCIAVAYFLKAVLDRFQAGNVFRLILIVLIMSRPVYYLVQMNYKTSDLQIREIEYVVQNSKESDRLYDGDTRFNVFRPDLHYFWFRVTRLGGLPMYNKITNNRFGDYDICGLIKSREPVFISDVGLDLEACGLTDVYENTEFDGLYIRKRR